MSLTPEQIAALRAIPPAQLCLRTLDSRGIPARAVVEDWMDGLIFPVPGEYTEMFADMLRGPLMQEIVAVVRFDRQHQDAARLYEAMGLLRDAIEALRADMARQAPSKAAPAPKPAPKVMPPAAAK